MDIVKVGFANDGEQNLKVEVVEKWTPKNITYVGDTVFFKNGDSYFSMKMLDFKRIFNL
jgi:hypothetical protein